MGSTSATSSSAGHPRIGRRSPRKPSPVHTSWFRSSRQSRRRSSSRSVGARPRTCGACRQPENGAVSGASGEGVPVMPTYHPAFLLRSPTVQEAGLGRPAERAAKTRPRGPVPLTSGAHLRRQVPYALNSSSSELRVIWAFSLMSGPTEIIAGGCGSTLVHTVHCNQ